DSTCPWTFAEPHFSGECGTRFSKFRLAPRSPIPILRIKLAPRKQSVRWLELAVQTSWPWRFLAIGLSETTARSQAIAGAWSASVRFSKERPREETNDKRNRNHRCTPKSRGGRAHRSAGLAGNRQGPG